MFNKLIKQEVIENESGVKELIDIAKNNSNSELEIRFGYYNKKRFNSEIDKYIYDKIRDFLSSKGAKTEETSLIKYHNNDIREVVYKDKTEYIKKIKKKGKYQIENYELNYRISYATEEKVEENTVKKSNNPTIRKRKRESYIFYKYKNFQIDLTVVETNGNKVYEMEIEIIKYNENSYKDLLGIITFFLEKIQLFTLVQYNTLLNRKNYNTGRYNNDFAGAQPETFKLKHLNLIRGTPYSITYKLDGERYLMFINSIGFIYLVNRKNQIKSFNNVANVTNIILDGELYEDEFYTFDVLYNNNIVNENLRERYNKLKDTIKEIGNKDIVYKEYYFSDDNNTIGSLTKKLDSEKEKYKKRIDGYIYTPINENYKYRKWSNLLKWKDAGDNTIDFEVDRSNPKEWKLYTKGKTGIVGFTHIRGKGEILVSKVTEEEAKKYTSKIVEFKYDKGKKTFVPYANRDDKLNANYIDVAYDNYDTIMNPVSIKALINENDDKDNVKKIRKCHNTIKRDLINRYGYNKDSLLDIAVGKGGDLDKWNRANIKNVVGIDINDTSINGLHGAKDRYNKGKYKTKAEFHVLDVGMNSIKDIVKERQFDIVSCQFAMHFFFENEKKNKMFFENVVGNLKENGYFVGTLFDGDSIFNLLKDKETYEVKDLYKISKKYKTENIENLNRYGEKIGIYLEGTNYFDTVLQEKENIEYLVLMKHLKEEALKYGLYLVETKKFEVDKCNLSKNERSYSELNRTVVFKKGKFQEDLLEGISHKIELKKKQKPKVEPLIMNEIDIFDNRYGDVNELNKSKDKTKFKKWTEYRDISYPFDLLKSKSNLFNRYKPISRAFYKLWECIHTFDLLKKDKPIITAHLAEGPGGFIDATMKYRNNEDDKYYAITLKKQLKDIPDFNKELNNRSNLNIIYGDLYDVKCVVDFKNRIGTSYAHLVTGDGGFETTPNYNNQEQKHNRLVFCQLVTGILCQKTNGHFVLKMFGTHTNFSADILFLFKFFYKDVYIYKPVTSRPANSERYIIAKTFNRKKLDDNKGLEAQLLTIIGNWDDNKHIHRLLTNNLPDEFIKSIKEYNDKINTVQINEINSIVSKSKSNDLTPSIDKEIYSSAWLNKYKL